MKRYESWGRFPRAAHSVFALNWHSQEIDFPRFTNKVLAFGLGRSYGDVCLNDGGTLLDTEGLRHLIAFDPAEGIVDCEAGITLAELLEIFLPKGWFAPVLPGTRHVTVGGAIANDIHGKNHHRAGTFGCHVLGFELLRSTGERLFCSPDQNAELFRATIGGLGLTGLILWVRLRLKAVSGPWMQVEHLPFSSLKEFFEFSRDSVSRYEYTVAWVDCVSGGGKAGRGVFIRGNHAAGKQAQGEWKSKPAFLRIPADAPGFLINRCSVRLLNEIYYQLQSAKRGPFTMPYGPFFFPLDSVEDWNRLYGKAGFLQYQVVLPEDGSARLKEFFEKISNSGLGSFLAVLKHFGPKRSPGLMSFPKAGVTLALDFPIRGRKVFDLLNALDEIAAAAGGSVYPGKDARMSPGHFRKFFPQWQEFTKYFDPAFSSDFKKRMLL